jgi:hypothetical protein
MVEIHNLDVTLDVEGEGDAAVFARLFEKHISAWSRREEESRKRQRESDAQRGLGDRPAGPGGAW